MRKLFFSLSCFFFLVCTLSFVSAVGIFPDVDDSTTTFLRFNNDSSVGENYGITNLIYDYGVNHNNASNRTVLVYNVSGGYRGDGAFLYNGISNFVSQTNFTGAYESTNITLSAWFYTHNHTLLQGIAGESDTSTRFSIGLQVRSDGKVGAQCNDNSSLNSAPSTAILPNTWYHAVVTYTPGHCTLYLNGNLISDSTTAQGYLRTGNSSLFVGRWGAFNQNYLNGSVDDVLILNRTISASEVQNMYSLYSGLECGATPADGCLVTQSTTFNQSTYNLNGSSTGAIVVKADNVILNCNNSVINGNWDQNSSTTISGINLYTSQNVTLQNCNITNYNYGVHTSSSTGVIKNSNFYKNRMGIHLVKFNSSSVYNNSFTNNSYASVWIHGNTYVSHIYQNTFNMFGGSGVRSEGSNPQFVNISNNIFYTNTSYCGTAIAQGTGSDWSVDRNTIYGCGVVLSSTIIMSAQNSTVSNNWMDATQYNIWVKDGNVNAYNITIINNTILNGGQGSTLGFTGGDLIFFVNNTVDNMTIGDSLDGYNVGLKINDASNVYVHGNTFSKIATVGVLSQGSYNVSIRNNTFDFIPLNERHLYGAKDTGQSEPRCAIQSTKRFKRFYDSFGNSNLTVFNNNFDGDTPCYLHLENQTLLSSDISSYWYTSFLINTTYAGLVEYYIPTYYDNISGWNGSEVFYEFTNYADPRYENINFNISRSTEFYRSNNATAAYSVTKYGLTNAVFSNQSSSIRVHGTNVSYTLVINPLDGYSFYNNNFSNTYMSLKGGHLKLSGSSAHIKLIN